MKRDSTKAIYDAQYKCRRCGELSPSVGDMGTDPAYGIGYSSPMDWDQWAWTREERTKYYDQLSSMIGHMMELPDLPNQYHVHKCADGELGVGDFVGFINRRMVKKQGRGWKLVEDA